MSDARSKMRGQARASAAVSGVIIAVWIYAARDLFWRDALPLDLAYYRDAGRTIAQGSSPYRVEGYLYPPLLARAFVPLLALSDRALVSGWSCLLGIATVLTPLCAIRAAKLERSPAAWVVLLMLFSESMTSGIAWGNVQPIITLLLLSTPLLLRRSPIAAGGAVGLSAALKVTPLLCVLYLWLAGRRDRPARRAFIAASVVIACAALAPYSREYVTRSLHGEFVEFKRYAGSNFSWVSYASLSGVRLPAWLPSGCAVLAAIALALRQGTREHDWAILVSLVLIGSPINWPHAFPLLLLPSALAWPALRECVGDRSAWAAALVWSLPWLVIAQCERFYAPDNAFTRSVFPLFPLLLPIGLVWLLWPVRASRSASLVVSP